MNAASISVLAGGAPTIDGADIANLSTVSAGGSIINGDRPMAGQTFSITATSWGGFELDSYTVLNQRTVGTSGGTWKIRLGTVSGTTFNEFYSDSVTVGNNDLDLSGSGDDWLQFNLTTPQKLQSDILYGIEINRTGGGNYLTLTRTADTEYADGTSYNNGPNGVGDSTINGFNNQDLTFHLNMVAVPEPCTALLSAFGLLGLLRRRR